jgi:hypothetical protein
VGLEQVFSCFAGAAPGQAEGAAGARVRQVGEPLRAFFLISSRGGTAAELAGPGGFGVFVRVGVLLAGVFGERGGGGVAGAVAAGGRGGGRQVVAGGLAGPAPQPGGEPGAGRHRGQAPGERLSRASVIPAGEACFPPSRADLPVTDGQVAGRGDIVVLDTAPPAASAALPCLFQQVRAGDDVHGQPAVSVFRDSCHDQARNPGEQGRRRAPLRAAGRRGLRVPRAGGSVHGWRFLLLIPFPLPEQE